MSDASVEIPDTLYGTIIATGISAQEYEMHYADRFHEWVEGAVIAMPPVSDYHDDDSDILRDIVKWYFNFNPIGIVRGAPFLMRLSDTVKREPDLQIILGENRKNLKSTYMDGAADICIEIVSPSNAGTDYVDKLREYEQFGVLEYWIFDPRHDTALFYRRNQDNVYKAVPTENGLYATPLLPRFQLPVAWLWQQPIPNVLQRMELVKSWFV